MKSYDVVIVGGGHNGLVCACYIQEYALVRLYREPLLYPIGEGTNDINRIVISRRTSGDKERSYLGLVQ